ncbi:uncharacterized protein PAF06_016588 [Gastrophryne carolinensis]
MKPVQRCGSVVITADPQGSHIPKQEEAKNPVKAYSIDRIIGGEECEPNSQPWQVALFHFEIFICGGILIDPNWVLTAAHCWATNINIRLGVHNVRVYKGLEQFRYAVKMCRHPNYNLTTYDNDIMLIKLDSPAEINDYVMPITLPTEQVEDHFVCTVSGWGSTTSPEETYPDVLQCLNITIIPHPDCQLYYEGEIITDNMLCAGDLEGGMDTCQGDSGGPLACDSILQGITSWGDPICGQPNQPGIFTKVLNYISWIQDIMENELMIDLLIHYIVEGIDFTALNEEFHTYTNMFHLLVIALLGTAVNGQLHNRIIGGYECAPNSQPWQATLHYFDTHACGGVLIDKEWILTAAHCQLPSIQIRLGDHDIKKYEGQEQFTYADKICPHKDFDHKTYNNDIMLLKLPEPVSLDAYVQPISIGCSPLPDGASCLVSGWGTTTSPEDNFPDTLQCVEVQTVSNLECQEAYPNDNINDNNLCAGVQKGGKDSCQGDSGGPLVCDSKLYGITSWGNVPCAVANQPGIYTKVCNYLNWIQETMANGDCLP